MLSVLNQFKSHFPSEIRLGWSHMRHPSRPHNIIACTIQLHQCPSHPINTPLIFTPCPLPSYIASSSSFTHCAALQGNIQRLYRIKYSDKNELTDCNDYTEKMP